MKHRSGSAAHDVQWIRARSIEQVSVVPDALCACQVLDH